MVEGWAGGTTVTLGGFHKTRGFSRRRLFSEFPYYCIRLISNSYDLFSKIVHKNARLTVYIPGVDVKLSVTYTTQYGISY